ncbi:hypothetical protein HPB48_008175 [Haemaphysalis longicornis]|uniref:Myb/SANT-like DNA-binding domain-containing protein n=1 Tax=Haemaphysalis longicornis TaxID=44386 RepID=A0A9J6H2L6_HAELO|nr:hypothetical protein HPB48_008175 [Haemaphysalis longicornis]
MAASSSCGSATDGSQRTSWTDDEVRTLIRVWEDHLGDLWRMTHNRKVYIAITAKLEFYGITKPVKAVKGKIENLGNTYRRLGRTLGTALPR